MLYIETPEMEENSAFSLHNFYAMSDELERLQSLACAQTNADDSSIQKAKHFLDNASRDSFCGYTVLEHSH